MFEMNCSKKILIDQIMETHLIGFILIMVVWVFINWLLALGVMLIFLFLALAGYIFNIKKRIQICNQEVIVSDSQKVDLLDTIRIRLAAIDNIHLIRWYAIPRYAFSFFMKVKNGFPKEFIAASFQADLYTKDDLKHFLDQVQTVNPSISFEGNSELWTSLVGVVPKNNIQLNIYS